MATEAVATAPRIFMVTKKASPVNGKWIVAVNEERKSKGCTR